MKASDELIKQRRAALNLAESEQIDTMLRNHKFCVKLCDALLDTINNNTTITKAQAEFLADTVSNVGYKFIPGHDITYAESPFGVCPFLVMQLATFINSCRE